MPYAPDYLGHDTPKLGFGLMRLPHLEDGSIDVPQVCDMVDCFLDAGLTYFDTAYVYTGSEEATRKALVERHPRGSYTLCSKANAWLGNPTADEVKRQFATSLERLGTDYLDFYLLHAIQDNNNDIYDQYQLWDWVRGLKEQGVIRHWGFSFHAGPDRLERLLTENPDIDFIQLQVNYADWNDDANVASRLNVAVAEKHGVPYTVMEPVKGGMLASLPEAAAAPLRKAAPDRSLASWALRFAASLDGLVTVLSGMSNTEQMKENLALMRDLPAFTEVEKAALAETQKYIASIPQVPCTGCSYCTKGCPQSIPIPDIFTAWNQYKVYENLTPAKRFYGFVTRGGQKASTCVECGQCESVCPQSIGIIEELKQVSAAFDA